MKIRVVPPGYSREIPQLLNWFGLSGRPWAPPRQPAVLMVNSGGAAAAGGDAVCAGWVCAPAGGAAAASSRITPNVAGRHRLATVMRSLSIKSAGPNADGARPAGPPWWLPIGGPTANGAQTRTARAP